MLASGLMATRKKAPPAPRKKRSDAKGLTLVGVRLEPAQAKALRAEAFKRAAARGTGKPDASEIVREALEAWLARR